MVKLSINGKIRVYPLGIDQRIVRKQLYRHQMSKSLLLKSWVAINNKWIWGSGPFLIVPPSVAQVTVLAVLSPNVSGCTLIFPSLSVAGPIF